MNVILPTIKELHFVSSVSAMVTMAFTSGNLSLIDGRLKIVHPLVMRSGIVAYAGAAITEIVYYSCKKFGRQERESSDELFGMQVYLASALAGWGMGNIIFANLEMQSENRLMELPLQDISALTWSTLTYTIHRGAFALMFKIF